MAAPTICGRPPQEAGHAATPSAALASHNPAQGDAFPRNSATPAQVHTTATTLATAIATARARVPSRPAGDCPPRPAATPERARDDLECRTRMVDTIAPSFWHWAGNWVLLVHKAALH